MEENRQTVIRFYESFKKGDVETMVASYADDAVFTDPAFGTLHGAEVSGMWRMLHEISKGNLVISYDQVEANDKEGSVHWTANYVFSVTGRSVTNHVVAHMEFKDGKIVRHVDSFSFYTWARQAFGVVGVLFGWTGVMQKLFQARSRKLLREYLQKHA